jgi:hypothetical protein
MKGYDVLIVRAVSPGLLRSYIDDPTARVLFRFLVRLYNIYRKVNEITFFANLLTCDYVSTIILLRY